MNQDFIRKAVLHNLADLGKDLKLRSNPNYWSFEKQHWSKPYVRQTESCRKVWSWINAGYDMMKALEWLKKEIPSGIESNRVSLLITQVKGLPTSWYFDEETLDLKVRR